MEQVYNYTSSDYVNGNITEGGSWTSQSNRIRPNDFIPATGVLECSISFSGANGVTLEAVISCLNSSGTLIREFYWLSSPATVTPPSNTAKIAVIFRKSNNNNLSPSDLDSTTITLTFPDTPTEWVMDGDQITNPEFIEMPEKPFVGDSPLTMWRITEGHNNNLPYSPLMIDFAALSGAFMDCANLSYVEIPHSCKSIGRYAFAGTALKKVKIAADCTYHSTSFPEDCEIEFYGGGGQWTQLIDGDGKAVVDGNGLRVYVEEEV